MLVNRSWKLPTYELESDGPIVLECYNLVSALDILIKMENYPNVQAVVNSIAHKKTEVQLKWMKHARECIAPAIIKYFEEHLMKADIMTAPMQAFKAAQMFSLHYVAKIKPECAPLNSLSNLSFMTSSVLSELVEEFPKYAALTNDISSDCTAIVCATIPSWNDAVRKVLVLLPSSAAAERVFSL